jgi:hypothetical protein
LAGWAVAVVAAEGVTGDAVEVSCGSVDVVETRRRCSVDDEMRAARPGFVDLRAVECCCLVGWGCGEAVEWVVEEAVVEGAASVWLLVVDATIFI